MPAGLYGIVNEMAGRLFMRLLTQADIDRLYPGRGYDMLQLSGIFSAAWKLGVFGLLLVQMYRMAWQPFFQQRHKDAGRAAICSAASSRYLCQFIGYASVTLMVFLDKLVAVPILGRPVIAPSYWVGPGNRAGRAAGLRPAGLGRAFHLGAVHRQADPLPDLDQRRRGPGDGGRQPVCSYPWLGLWGATLSAILCLPGHRHHDHAQKPAAVPHRHFLARMIPILIWLAFGWGFGTAVQMRPDAFSWGIRLGALLAFWTLPFVIGTLPRRGLLAALPGLRRRKT